MSKKGSTSLQTLIGLLFVFGGIVVAFLTAIGFVNRFVPSEIASASYGYGIGAVLAIILLIIGVYILQSEGK